MSISKISSEGGNTKPPQDKQLTTKVKWRRVCFTDFNFTSDMTISLSHRLRSIATGWIWGEELTQTGKPHLQGYIEFKNQVTLTNLKTILPTAHWEKARGTRADNIKYCSKEHCNIVNEFPLSPTETRNKRIIAKHYTDITWKGWQQEVLDIIREPIDDRIIHWFWEPVGNSGKSFLTKYLAITYNAIICEGKKDNIFNQVNIWLQNNEDMSPNIVIADVPRSAFEFVNYGVLEQLKNGLLYSGKYEGGICCFEHPHLIIFANELPQQHRLSKDRWKIHYIH